MKFQPDTLPGANVITRHAPGEVWVGASRFGSSVLVPWQGEVQVWRPASVAELEPADFEALLASQPELVIFGSGPRQRFVSAALYRTLLERRIGFETMDTGAACRTYNVLVTEGRHVLAALIVEPAGTT